MGFSFGELKRKGKTTTSRGTPTGTTEVSKPTKVVDRGRTDWKKKFKGSEAELKATKKAYDQLVESIADLNDQNEMLLQQEQMSKKAMDMMSQEVERYKFRPHQYSQIAQILNCLHVNFNPRQKQALENLIGSSSVIDARKAIFDLLEAPYNE